MWGHELAGEEIKAHKSEVDEEIREKTMLRPVSVSYQEVQQMGKSSRTWLAPRCRSEMSAQRFFANF